MFVQLEIVTRRLGRFVKVQDVLVDGEQIATLHKVGTTWVLTFTNQGPFDPRIFRSRDSACDYLFDMYTREPETGPFSLAAPSAYDQHIDNLYKSTDEYFKESA